MAGVASRRWAPLPTREDLGATSRWVWLLLAMAALLAVLRLIATTSITIDIVVGAVLATAPLLTAAALMYVAPRERLVAVAALGVAVPPAVRLAHLAFVDTRVLYPPWLPDTQYVDIAQKVGSVTDAAASFNWIFTLLAVLCLAFYVGVIRSRIGWAIVLVGVVMAAVNGVAFYQAWAPMLDLQIPDDPTALQNIVFGILGQLVTVAWAYLAAVALDRRLVLLTLATFAPIALAALSRILFLGLIAAPPDGASFDSFGLISAGFYAVGVALDVLLIAAILVELPRSTAPATATLAVSPEA